MPTISHSEAESFLTCRRKHYYGYVRKLTKSEPGEALGYGSAGHKILETFYREIAQHTNKRAQRSAVKLAWLAAEKQWKKMRYHEPEGYESLEFSLFERYRENEPLVRQGYKILGVEQDYNLRYDEELDLQYPFVVDVLAEDPQGKVVVIDHKFVKQFYSTDDVALMPQLPKYIGALRGLGKWIDYGAYNQIKSAKLKVPTVAQSLSWMPVKPTPARILRTFHEQVQTAIEIHDFKADFSPEEQDELALRTSNKTACRYCDFRSLCAAELEGAGTRLLMNEYEAKGSRTFEVTEDLL